MSCNVYQRRLRLDKHPRAPGHPTFALLGWHTYAQRRDWPARAERVAAQLSSTVAEEGAEVAEAHLPGLSVLDEQVAPQLPLCRDLP